MIRRLISLFLLSVVCVIFNKNICLSGDGNMIKLPEPRLKGDISIEEAINKRRSVRSFSNKDLSLEDISQLLWAAQGITDKGRGFRSAPSAGALYPLEIYVIKGDGFFHYVVEGHSLEVLGKSDLRNSLSDAALGQSSVREAAVDIVICAVYSRVTSKYGERGIRYVHIEAGHCAQNIHLMAVALGLSSVPIGAFSDNEVKALFNLGEDIEPLYIIPVGYSR